MLTRFDHAVVGVRSREQGIDLWRSQLGFDAQPGGRHTGRGTHNAIVRFGLDYVELISIDDRALVEQRGDENALALAALLDRSPGGLLGFALATDDIEADAVRLRANGLAVRGPTPMERMRPDGRLLRWRLLVPAGGSWGTPLPFFIQWDVPDAERLTWERPGTHGNGARSIASLAITVSDLDRWADVYERQLELEPLGRDRLEALGARRAHFRCGQTQLDILAPDGAGPVADAVAAGHEAPWQLTIRIAGTPAARQFLSARGINLRQPSGESSDIPIPPEQALNARLLLSDRA